VSVPAACGGRLSRQILRTDERCRSVGWVAIADGHLAEADAHFRKVLDAAVHARRAHLRPVTYLGLGQVCLLKGDFDEAQELHRRALIQVLETEPGGMTMADTLLDAACVDTVAGRHARAQRLLGANETWYDAHGGVGRVWRGAHKAVPIGGGCQIPERFRTQRLVVECGRICQSAGCDAVLTL
jgi:hypothetical protein